MASVDDTVIATELVSKPQKIAAPRYRYMKVYPMKGSTDIVIPAGGRDNVQFEIPTQSFNYSKSYICGSLQMPQATNGAGYGHWLYKDCVAWCNRASFKTRGGATLFDLDYVNNYTKVVNRFEAHMDDVMTGDPSDVLYAATPSYTIDYKTAEVKDISDVKTNVVTNDLKFIPAGNKRPNGIDLDHPFVEAAYCQPSKTLRAGAADTGILTWDFRIPLSKLVPNSVFSRKSDLKLPEIAILSLVLGPGTKISWEGTSLTNPSDSAAECSAATTIKHFYLHLAKQDDPNYEVMFDERIRTGFSIPINVPIHSMTKISTPSERQNISVTYNSGYGHRLVRIYHSVFNPDEKKNTAYDNSCEGKTPKIKSYHVKIQGSRTSDEELIPGESPTTGDPNLLSAYLYHKDLLEGTSVTSANIFAANFVHIEDVARIGGPKRWKELGFRKDDAIIGQALDQDYKFEFVAETQTAAYDHYTFAIVQRLLRVEGATVVVE